MSLTCLKCEEKCVCLDIFHCVMSDPFKLDVIVSYIAFKEGNFISNLPTLIMKSVFQVLSDCMCLHFLMPKNFALWWFFLLFSPNDLTGISKKRQDCFIHEAGCGVGFMSSNESRNPPHHQNEFLI